MRGSFVVKASIFTDSLAGTAPHQTRQPQQQSLVG
jgi:hypothetical protein